MTLETGDATTLETGDTAMERAAEDMILALSTPEAVRQLTNMWHHGRDASVPQHDWAIGTWLATIVELCADDIAAKCARASRGHKYQIR